MIALLPYAAPFAVGLAGARYLGQPWLIAVGLGVANSAVSGAAWNLASTSSPDEALPTFTPAASTSVDTEGGSRKGGGRKKRPSTAKNNSLRRTTYGALTIFSTYPSGMLAANNPRREGVQAQPNIGAGLATVIGTVVQAGAGVASAGIGAAATATGVRAQQALERQRMELEAQQALSANLAATEQSGNTMRTVVLVTGGVLGLVTLGGLGLVLLRSR